MTDKYCLCKKTLIEKEKENDLWERVNYICSNSGGSIPDRREVYNRLKNSDGRIK